MWHKFSREFKFAEDQKFLWEKAEILSDTGNNKFLSNILVKVLEVR